MKENETTITIRVPADVKRQIQATAWAERQSVSEWCCKNLVAAMSGDVNNLLDMRLPIT